MKIQNISYERSNPIEIKKNISQGSQYGLTESNFDPNKNSPPNSWTRRLNTRIDNYCSFNILERDSEK
jgi:hypothetical protein